MIATRRFASLVALGACISLPLAGCPGSSPSSAPPAPAPAPAPTPPPAMTPPFGDGVLLDWYEWGGIDGRAHRVRVTADEAVLYFFDQEQVRSPLTDDEREALADLVASLGPIASHHSDGPDVRDGLSGGLFVAGTGAGRDGSGASTFAARLERRLTAERSAKERR